MCVYIGRQSTATEPEPLFRIAGPGLRPCAHKLTPPQVIPGPRCNLPKAPPTHARRNTIPRTRVALRWAQHAPCPSPLLLALRRGAARPLSMPGPPRRGEGTWHGVGARLDYHGTDMGATRFASHPPIKGDHRLWANDLATDARAPCGTLHRRLGLEVCLSDDVAGQRRPSKKRRSRALLLNML